MGGGKISGRVDGVYVRRRYVHPALPRESRTPPSPPPPFVRGHARAHTLVEKKKKKENLNHPFGDDINAGDAP